MRIAFVAGNREQMPDPVIPIGLLSVAAACADRHEKHVWDLCFEDDADGALAEHLGRTRVDLIAIGVRNVQNNDYTGTRENLAYYRSLVRTVRARTDAPIVLGGGGFSVMPEELLVSLGADYGITGEGELVLAALASALERGEPIGSVGGLIRREGEKAIRNPGIVPFARLDQLPLIDRRLVDRRHYERCGIDAVQTKRGCPLRCDYCTYPAIEGRAYRLRDPLLVARELEDARAAGARHVFVVDSVFNLPARHAHAVCAVLRERGPLPWTCYANPIAFDRSLADAMRGAGCVGVEVGSDSGVEAVLERLKKGFDLEHIRRFHRIAADAGLLDCHTFLLGTPGETLDDVRRTLDFVAALEPFAAILMVWTDDHEALDPSLAAARAELRGQILELLEKEAARRPRWIVPALGVNFRPRTFALLRRRGLVGPLWQHLDRLAPPA